MRTQVWLDVPELKARVRETISLAESLFRLIPPTEQTRVLIRDIMERQAMIRAQIDDSDIPGDEGEC
jgi:hypothetical protein